MRGAKASGMFGPGMAELRMIAQLFPGGQRQSSLAVNRFPEGFGAGGAAGALKPFCIERLGDEIEGVGGDSGLLLFSGGMAGADEEARQQEGHTQHGAAGIGGQGARPRWV